MPTYLAGIGSVTPLYAVTVKARKGSASFEKDEHNRPDTTLETLAALYRLASVFVFPSLYEGFGLPPLEAMASGTPVVTSNVSSLPEVVGDAAVLVDPYDVASIVDGVRRVLTQPQLATDLRRKGLVRAREFSWERSVARIREIYFEVAAR